MTLYLPKKVYKMAKKRDCAMCYDETMENNPIIKCEICEIGVHVLCYSIQDTNNFKCSPCAKDVSPSTVYCAICNKSGGAMKSTTKGKYVHVICIFFEPNSKFVNVKTAEPVDIENVDISKRKSKCVFCDEKSAAFKCAKRGCKQRLHASCSLENWTIEEKVLKNDDIKFNGYCSADHFDDGNSKSKKRLSSEHVKKLLNSKTEKQSYENAAKSNSHWIIKQMAAREGRYYYKRINNQVCTYIK